MDHPPNSYRSLFITYLRPQWRRATALALLLLGSIGLQLLSPQIIRAFIDNAVAGASTQWLLTLALLFIGVALVAQGASVAATYLSGQIGWAATNALRADLALHCLRLDMQFHHARTPGELIERIDGDVTALATLFSQLVVRVLGSALLLVGVLALLFREDWRVGAALTLFALIALVVLIRTRNLAVPSMIDERQAHAHMFGFIEERLAGLDDLRANGGGSYTLRRLYEVMRPVFFKGRRATMMGGMLFVLTLGLFTLGYALALGLGAYLYSLGTITIGTVLLFFQYTQLLRQPLEQISSQLKEFQKASAGIGRIGELLAIERTIHDGTGGELSSGPLAVAFEEISFGYADEGRKTKDEGRKACPELVEGTEDESQNLIDHQPPTTDNQPLITDHRPPTTDHPVLHDLSFNLEPGRVLGLLGRTGSGKSTLARLLFRLYEPAAGVIRLGNVDISRLRLRDLRERIAIVTQDVQLFGASVRDNLTLFDSSIADARILEVLDDLELTPWLHALPAGLDSELTPGGGGLSAGEAQLLAFARVFLQDPGLVILDEASSRLDPATERRIERAVDALLHNRTGIIIAHRLATVQRADEILILEGGRIREHGLRTQLAADPHSRFAQLLHAGFEDVLS